jgi:hypothetical protein
MLVLRVPSHVFLDELIFVKFCFEEHFLKIIGTCNFLKGLLSSGI